jgi:hypothetical protein
MVVEDTVDLVDLLGSEDVEAYVVACQCFLEVLFELAC